MRTFFSPRSKLVIRAPVARFLNTLNLLGPALLFVALILLAVAGFGNWPPEEDRMLVSTAGILIAAALMIRMAWGIAVHVISRNAKADTKQ